MSSDSDDDDLDWRPATHRTAAARFGAEQVRIMLAARTAHLRSLRGALDPVELPSHAVAHVPPPESPSLADLRAATRLLAEGHAGALASTVWRKKRVSQAAGVPGDEGAPATDGAGSSSKESMGTQACGAHVEPGTGKKRIGDRCPLQAIAHHAVRKLDAVAMGRRVRGAALTSSLLPTVRSAHLLDDLGGRVYNARFIGDYGLYVASAQNQLVRVYDMESSDVYTPIRDIHCQDAAWTVSDLDVLFEGGGGGSVPRSLVYSSLNSIVQLVNLESQRTCEDVPQALDLSPHGDVRSVWAIKVSRDNSKMIAGVCVRDLNHNPLGVYRSSYDSGGGIVVYDLESQRVLYSVRAHDHHTNTIAYLNKDMDPNLLLSGADDGLTHMWDLREMKSSVAGGDVRPACTFVGHTHGLTHVDSRDDGRFFISTSKDSSIKLWDVRRPSSSNPAQWNIHRDLDFDYRFSAYTPVTQQPSGSTDSSVITYRGGHTILKTLIRARFSPRVSTGQRYIQTGSADGNCVLYDATTAEIVAKLEYHRNVVRDSSWHPTRQLLTTSSWDSCIAMWGVS